MSSYPTRQKERKSKAPSLLKENHSKALQGLAIKPDACKQSKIKVKPQSGPRVK